MCSTLRQESICTYQYFSTFLVTKYQKIIDCPKIRNFSFFLKYLKLTYKTSSKKLQMIKLFHPIPLNHMKCDSLVVEVEIYALKICPSQKAFVMASAHLFVVFLGAEKELQNKFQGSIFLWQNCVFAMKLPCNLILITYTYIHFFFTMFCKQKCFQSLQK